MTEGQIFANRFRCTASIKSGPGTATLRGTDLHEPRDVIIKTVALSAVAPDALLRLEHEARVLGALHTPNLTPVIEVGRQDGQVYVVTPAVPGITLEARLTRGPLTVEETLVVGRSLCAALQQAHDHGILHRDVKPANIIVDDDVPLRRATLIDFGFARSPLLDVSIREVPVGTIRYMAPEQAGLLNRPVDERSDLYAVGLVLFECLAGHSPLCGMTAAEVLREQLSTCPPDLRSLGCALPRALDEILHRLLRKDPDDRYQTAEGVLADLTTVADAVAGGVADPPLVVGLRDSRRTLAEPAFVGRQEELAALDAQWERARSGRGGLVLLEAESGGGKTRVLDEWAKQIGQHGAWVLRGQGIDHSALRPFQLLDGVVQGLLARGRCEQGFAARLAARVGEERDAICEAVPHLASFLDVDVARPLSLGHEAHGEVRSLRALMCLLDALGSPERPAVVLLDDVQWADDLAVKLLDQWSRRESPETYGLIVAAFRAEEVSEDHPLRRVSAAARLTLAPFCAADLHRVAESMAGKLPEEALTVIVRLAEGSPFMATAVLQGLVEAGALIPDPLGTHKWQLDHSVLDDIRSSHRAAVFLARRLDGLPGETLRVLSVGAVLGKEFDPRLAGDLADLSDDAVAAGGLDARRRHLLWSAETGVRWVFVHDKIREALLSRLGDDERRRLHAAAAARLEAEDPQRIFELAYHFDEAGAHERALPYALAAAEHARARSALEIAERHYRIAERGLSRADRFARCRVAEGLGAVLMLRGRYPEAESQLTSAVSFADDVVVRARLEGEFGELAFKRGDVKTASKAIERALGLLRHPVPCTPVGLVGSLVLEIVGQIFHTLFPQWFVARRRLETAQNDLLAARLYSRLAYAYWFARGAIPTLWAHLREMNLAERYPPTRELGQACANHSVVMTMLPLFPRAIAYAEKGRAIREELGDQWGVAQSLGFYGLVLQAAARNEDALVMFRESTRRLERSGDLWELNNALFNTAYCQYRVGDLAGALELGRRVLQSGHDIGNVRDLAIGLEILAKASGGKVSRDLIRSELARASDDIHSVVTVMQAEAVCLIADRRSADAA
ncbi:MAG: AAA family ATPase, partial [Nitrospiria bacterium]